MNIPHLAQKNAAVLAVAVILPLAVPRADAATVHTQGPVQYVCGGVGQGALHHLQAQAGKFDLGFWMVKGPRGEYLADVPVKIAQHGKTLASFTAAGPLCYLKVPAGTYTITGSHDGVTRTIRASGGMAHVLRW